MESTQDALDYQCVIVRDNNKAFYIQKPIRFQWVTIYYVIKSCTFRWYGHPFDETASDWREAHVTRFSWVSWLLLVRSRQRYPTYVGTIYTSSSRKCHNTFVLFSVDWILALFMMNVLHHPKTSCKTQKPKILCTNSSQYGFAISGPCKPIDHSALYVKELLTSLS